MSGVARGTRVAEVMCFMMLKFPCVVAVYLPTDLTGWPRGRSTERPIVYLETSTMALLLVPGLPLSRKVRIRF